MHFQKKKIKKKTSVEKYRVETFSLWSISCMSNGPFYLHYLPLSSLGMVGTTQVSFLFADHITTKNGYMKRAYTRQRMPNNKNSNKRKQV